MLVNPAAPASSVIARTKQLRQILRLLISPHERGIKLLEEGRLKLPALLLHRRGAAAGEAGWSLSVDGFARQPGMIR